MNIFDLIVTVLSVVFGIVDLVLGYFYFARRNDDNKINIKFDWFFALTLLGQPVIALWNNEMSYKTWILFLVCLISFSVGIIIRLIHEKLSFFVLSQSIKKVNDTICSLNSDIVNTLYEAKLSITVSKKINNNKNKQILKSTTFKPDLESCALEKIIKLFDLIIKRENIKNNYSKKVKEEVIRIKKAKKEIVP